jgi:hypothetical protein
MSNESSVSDTTTNTSGESSENSNNNNNQPLAEHAKKLLGEKKKVQSENDELKKRLQEFEQKDLESKGKQSELIDSLRKDLRLKEEKLSQTIQTYSQGIVSGKLREELVKQGCLDVDLLVGSINLKEIEVDPDNNWSVNQDDLQRVVQEKIQKHQTLFRKSAPKVIDGKPVGQVSSDIKKASTEELINAWKALK